MCRRKMMMIATAACITGIMAGCGTFKNEERKTGENSTAAENRTEEETTGQNETDTDKTAENETPDNITTPTQENATEEKTSEDATSVNAGVTEHATLASGEISYEERVNFEKAAFLGDSRTEGLRAKLVVSGADFYTSIGITVKGVLDKKEFDLKNGEKGNMLEAVSEKEYDKIYLMFGINELGWPYKESFEEYYTTVINTLKQRFPNAQIYIQSIIPMVESRTDENYNNEKIARFNGYIKEVADNTGVYWIDVSPSVVDSTGALPVEASNDGIHLSRDYLFKWADYLKEKTYY